MPPLLVRLKAVIVFTVYGAPTIEIRIVPSWPIVRMPPTPPPTATPLTVAPTSRGRLPAQPGTSRQIRTMPCVGAVPRLPDGVEVLAIAPEIGANTPGLLSGPGTKPARTFVRRTDTMPPFDTTGSVTGRIVLSDRPGIAFCVPKPAASVLRWSPAAVVVSVVTPIPVSD